MAQWRPMTMKNTLWRDRPRCSAKMRSRNKRWSSVGALLSVLCFLSMHSASAGEINVSAAASLTDALQAIGGDYEKETGDKIVFNFAGSSVLERQIEAGVPADVFFSADEAKMDMLEDHG